ncbi:MAG: adenylosuccinate lyase [Candidatus Peribacteraceae bacterium]|nr:adenylosuccinate lyase [Candidatus Peribacteraceae bacterium]
MLTALCPLDGRYRKHLELLSHFFSEEALIRARLRVEIEYFIALSAEPKVRQLKKLKAGQVKALRAIAEKFGTVQAEEVKAIEAKTNHDMKAVEYFLKGRMQRIAGLKHSTEFVHFALTSEDISNLAYGLLIHEALKEVVRPGLKTIIGRLNGMARRWKNVSLLSLTHGQPATPTTVGKEMLVFAERLERQYAKLLAFKMQGKFGGAVGNFSAHRAAYPEIDWPAFGRRFVRSLKLDPLTATTQINPHDDLAELSHLFEHINTILIGFCRDAWMYISRGVFRQKVVAGEVGSSTMPHKVNPIDFENAEGNLGLANALFEHFAQKLPVSRLQRDLTDSTVQRNVGVAFGYHALAVTALRRGLSKLSLDRVVVRRELDAHPEVRAEAVQTVLRKHGVEGAYEKLKKLTRGERVTHASLDTFVESLPLPRGEKQALKAKKGR